MSDIRRLVLASASPRRADLLTTLGVDYTVQAADIDESLLAGEAAGDYVARLASEKAFAVQGALAEGESQVVVLAADTAVVIDTDILGKPGDRLDALAMLARLSGRSHSVFTGVCLLGADIHEVAVVETRVQFANLSHADCEAYIDSGEPFDKAGGYGIQGLGGALVERIEGSYSNVVGLPLAQTRALLQRAGVQTALEIHRE